MRTTLFICYSHVDKRLRDQLMVQLQGCSEQVSVWTDQAIPAGVQWLPEIDRALSIVDVALIVLSPELIASPFIREREVPRILERHRQDGLRPYWVHARPGLYERHPIAAFQCLHDPKQPLSTLPRARREVVLAQIARQICDAPAQRSIGNVLRAADEVFTQEQGVPSVIAEVRPDGIDMRYRGEKRARPLIDARELESKLTREDRQVLRSHERAMDALMRRWSRLHVAQAAQPGPPGADALRQVRSELAREFDAALGFIEQLGYTLDDHYLAVRHVVGRAAGSTVPRVDSPSLNVRFVLDKKDEPQWSRRENGYWLQAWLDDAPTRTASVTWQLHPTITPAQETVDTRSEFRKDFVTHGDFTVRARLRDEAKGTFTVLSAGVTDALRREHAGARRKAVREAIDDIAKH